MRQNSFLIYLSVEIIVGLIVPLIFLLIPDRQIAALCAGVLFILIPPLLFVSEYRRSQFQNLFWLIVLLQFWLFFALPIFGLRVLNWGIPFRDLTFLNIIKAQQLHNWSNTSYLILVLLTAIKALKGWRGSKR